jgi:outer membrane protein assembly factor BamD (BamD/ComL family)
MKLNFSNSTLLFLTIALMGCGGKYVTYEQQMLSEADSLFREGNYEFAKVKFDKVRSLKPGSPAARTAQFYLGYINVYYENPFANWEAALREFKLFVSLYPQDARVDEVNSWIKLLVVMQSFKRDYMGTTNRLEELRHKKTTDASSVSAAPQKQPPLSIDGLSESLRMCNHARDSLNQKSKDLENFIIDFERKCKEACK